MPEHSHNPPRCAPKPESSWIRVLEEQETSGRILDGLHDGILMNTADGVALWVNRSMTVILGMDREKAVGRRIEELFGEDIRELRVDPDAGPAAEAGRRTWAAHGREYEVDSVRLRSSRKGGAAEITVLHDVTEKRNLEQHRSHILSMVSHDVRAPLTTILGYCELILDGSMGGVPDEVDEAVGAMMRSGKKVLGIIEDFLIAAKTDAGLTRPSFRPTELVSLFRGLVDGMSPDIRRVGRTLLFEPSEERLKAECDPRLLERVVSNLIDNAVKYSSNRGTIRLTVGLDESDAVEIRVSDDGIGISEEELPFVFDRYWRGSRVGGIHGSGLGLSIVKQLVELHSGTIDIESERGAGTTVRVLIPKLQTV